MYAAYGAAAEPWGNNCFIICLHKLKYLGLGE